MKVVLLCGDASWGTLGSIISIKQSLITVHYDEIIVDQSQPIMAKIFPVVDDL